MAPSHILQIFLRVTVQNQIGIAQRIVVDVFPAKLNSPEITKIQFLLSQDRSGYYLFWL